MEKIITGRVPGGREIFRIFARSRSNKFYFRFGQTSTSKSSSFFVLIKDKSITSHYGPTINALTPCTGRHFIRNFYIQICDDQNFNFAIFTVPLGN